eukprot:s772_g13.t1
MQPNPEKTVGVLAARSELALERLASEVESLVKEADGLALCLTLFENSKSMKWREAETMLRKVLLQATEKGGERWKVQYVTSLLRCLRDGMLELLAKLQKLGCNTKCAANLQSKLRREVSVACREFLQTIGYELLDLHELVAAAPRWMLWELLDPPTLVRLPKDFACLEIVLKDPKQWGWGFGSSFPRKLRWLKALQPHAESEAQAQHCYQRLVDIFVASLAAAFAQGHKLRRKTKPELELLQEVRQLLTEGELPEDLKATLLTVPSERGPRKSGSGSEISGKGGNRPDLSCFPAFRMPASASCTWVDTAESWAERALPRLSRAEVASIDTEWGPDVGKGPVLVQIAVGDGLEAAECFLIDTLLGPPALALCLLRWLQTTGLLLLGWSFTQDRKRFAELGHWVRATLPAEKESLERDMVPQAMEVYDLQLPLQKLMKATDQPSLSFAAAHLLGHRLDKTEQCSDWCCRPLSEAQQAYAALDSAVLLEMHKELQRRGAG